MHPTRVTGCISYICSKSCINISTGKYGPRWKVAGNSVRMIGNACVKHTHTRARTLAHACIQRAAMFYPFAREIFNIYFNFTIFCHIYRLNCWCDDLIIYFTQHDEKVIS